MLRQEHERYLRAGRFEFSRIKPGKAKSDCADAMCATDQLGRMYAKCRCRLKDEYCDESQLFGMVSP